ncbi:MAG: hemerythrin family protein [Acidobacteria bacterium]|nr:hemerythrin family protein [Acidobacteriota bacterium]
MGRLIWNPAWETGIATIDAQHREIYACIEGLFRSIRQGRESEEIPQAIGFLLAFAETHFRDEEALMDRSGYPRAEGHRKSHGRLREMAKSLPLEPGLDQEDPAGALLDFFTEYLISHICEEDQPLAEWLRRHPSASGEGPRTGSAGA